MDSTDKRGIAAVLGSTVFLGIGPIWAKQAYGAGMDPLSFLAVRWTLASLLVIGLWSATGWRRYLRINRRNLAGCVVVGSLNSIVGLTYFYGLETLSASVAQFVYSTYPVMVILLVWMLGGQRPLMRAWLRAALTLAGVSLLTGVGGGVDRLGLILVIGTSVAQACYLVAAGAFLGRLDSRTSTVYVLSTMGVTFTLLRLLVGGHPIPNGGVGLSSVVLMALFPSLTARLLLFYGLRRIGSAQAALVGMAEPMLTAAFAIPLLGESLNLVQWLGASFIVLSLALAREPQRRGQVPQDS